MKQSKEAPNVFDYLDVFSFLQDYYKFRKEKNAQFSYESWAAELGVNSRSFLRLVILGKKKISPKLEESFSAQMFLQKAEKEYFYYLIRHSQATQIKDKQAFAAKMIQILRSNSNQELIENYAEFVSTPVLPRLLTLLSFQDIHPIAKTFARLLRIDLAETENHLQKLEKLGLAQSEVFDGETHWKALNTKFKVPDQVGSEKLLEYHKSSLADAIKAFHQPKELRRYKSLLLPLSKEDLKEFYNLLDTFAAEQTTRYNSKTYSGKKLFQANFNIHVVAEES